MGIALQNAPSSPRMSLCWFELAAACWPVGRTMWMALIARPYWLVLLPQPPLKLNPITPTPRYVVAPFPFTLCGARTPGADVNEHRCVVGDLVDDQYADGQVELGNYDVPSAFDLVSTKHGCIQYHDVPWNRKPTFGAVSEEGHCRCVISEALSTCNESYTWVGSPWLYFGCCSSHQNGTSSKHGKNVACA